MKRHEILELARASALAGEYVSARRQLGHLLNIDPRDLDALRLLGNALELQAIDDAHRLNIEMNDCESFKHARACYQRILLADPNHVGALVDLGTYWRNGGENGFALEYYERALACLSPQSYKETPDEFLEALQGKIELLENAGDWTSAADVRHFLRDLPSQLGT